MAFGQGRGDSDGFIENPESSASELPDEVRAWIRRDPLRALGHVVRAVVADDPPSQPSAAGTDLIRLRRRTDQLEACFATRALDAHRKGVGIEDGHASTPAWIAWKAGMHRGAVARSIRHAELAELLPATGAAWREGRITTTAVEMIAAARVDECDDELAAMEPEFLDRAERGDHKSLRTLTQHFRACARADGSKPEPPDGVKLAPVGDRFVLSGDFGKAAGETVAEALDTFTRPPTAEDGTSLAVRRAEALVRLCEVALARGTDAEGSRPVVSYLTQERREDDPAEPLTLGTFAGVIDPCERDRILCDAIVVPVTTDHAARILNVGRATSTWNRAQRRAMAARSPHCQWPGCEVPAPWLDAHHFVHWEHGGCTDLANGVHLCRRHHTFLHRHRDWRYTFEHEVLRVFRADGTELHRDPWVGMTWVA